MQKRTEVKAGEGMQDLWVIREFDLPVELLFRAYVEPEIVEQWMGTRVLKMENRKHGSWEIETADNKGNVAFVAGGVIHDIKPNERITRTFEMEGAPFGVQLEFLEFEKLTDQSSRLNMHIVFRTAAQRDQMLKMPFAQGVNMAHNRLQEIVSKLI